MQLLVSCYCFQYLNCIFSHLPNLACSTFVARSNLNYSTFEIFLFTVMKDADLDLAVQSSFFAAVGTAGQRCTTVRRLFLHEDIAEAYLSKLISAYQHIRLGDPLDPVTLCGPLHNEQAVKDYSRALDQVKEQGGQILFGGQIVNKEGNYVTPTLTRGLKPSSPVVQHEVFVPILHTFTFKHLKDAVAYNNGVSQGLSSSLFTKDISAAMKWIG